MRLGERPPGVTRGGCDARTAIARRYWRGVIACLRALGREAPTLDTPCLDWAFTRQRGPIPTHTHKKSVHAPPLWGEKKKEKVQGLVWGLTAHPGGGQVSSSGEKKPDSERERPRGPATTNKRLR